MPKIIIDNVYTKLEGFNQETLALIDSELAVPQPGYFFSPSFKNGLWDGKIHFFDKRSQSFPTGLLNKVLAILEGTEFELQDNRKPFKIEVPDEIDLFEPEAENGVITLRDYQHEAVANALRLTRGIINVATNGGKTEIASGIIKLLLPKLKEKERILFVTHSKEIFHQSAKRIEKRLNIKVGKVGDGIWDVKPVTLIMIPTVSRYIKKPKKKDKNIYKGNMKSVKLLVDLLDSVIKKDEENRKIMINALQILEEQEERDQKAIDILTDILSTERTDLGCYSAFQKLKIQLKGYEEERLRKATEGFEKVKELLESGVCFIGDEAHHSSSSTWYDTLMMCKNAVYRFGLTGTVDKKDKINLMRLYGCMGEIVTKISNDFLIRKGYSAKPTIFLQTVKKPELFGLEFQEAYEKGIVENEYRNKLIAKKVYEKYKENKGCLIIVNRKKHGEIIEKLLVDMGVECAFTHGSFENREGVLEDLRTGKLKVLIATSILDEGVDVSGIHCLWLAAGGKSFRQILQRIGRGLRKKEDGSGVEVYDFLDYTNEHLIKHTQERYHYYKAEKFEIKRVD